MSGRICAVMLAPSKADADSIAAAVEGSADLFGEMVPVDTTAITAEIQGSAYLLIRGDHGAVVAAMSSPAAAEYDEISQSWRDGDTDAGAATWLPGDALACMILGMRG